MWWKTIIPKAPVVPRPSISWKRLAVGNKYRECFSRSKGVVIITSLWSGYATVQDVGYANSVRVDTEQIGFYLHGKQWVDINSRPLSFRRKVVSEKA